MRVFSLVRAIAIVLCTASVATAQLAGQIGAACRSGQTFVTWREASTSGVRYRVYRSAIPVRGAADLAQSDFLGEVDDRSSVNAVRSAVERSSRTWIVVDGGAPLAANQGLFVHTIEEASAQAFYAVTSVRRGVENTTIVPGQNASLAALVELAAPPQPVLQARDTTREVWGHWVSDRDTPHQPALSLTPSRGFDFCYEPGQAGFPRGLLLRLHSATSHYVDWPSRELVPLDVDILALSDAGPAPGFTSWFGAHERFPAAPAADTRVWAFTQQRALWTLDWIGERLGSALDPERVVLVGSSLGATGGMYLLGAAPERFAAALLRNGNYDLTASDFVNRSPYEQLFGSFSLGLSTRSGMPILERTRARSMASVDPAVDWPLVRTLNGRQDTVVGWASSVDLIAGLRESFRPAVHYFDNRRHGASGSWSALERTLIERTCRVRRDRPSLRFGACSLDDDPGDGARQDGDRTGTVNGSVEYDPLTASASFDAVRFDVSLRAEGALDDAQSASGFATLTPRRTGPFAPAAGEVVHFTLREAGALVDEHWLTPDASGLVHTPLVPLSTAVREARFEREAQAASARPRLRLGGAPLAGDELQAFVNARGDAPWILFLVPGTANGPWHDVAGFTASGTCDARGIADVRIELPLEVPAGTWLWGRTLCGGTWSPWSMAIVQAGRGPRSVTGAPPLRR